MYDDGPITYGSPVFERKHASISAALTHAGMDGTQSILDINGVAQCSLPDLNSMSFKTYIKSVLGKIFPLSVDEVKALFGTYKPTYPSAMSIILEERDYDAWNYFWSIPRGTCRHMIIYESECPTALLFAGYSLD